MDDLRDERDHNNKLWWGLQVFRKDPDLFACWCTVDALGCPWALGLFDEDFGGRISLYGRHMALITSPVVTLSDLPVRRTHLSDAGWSNGLCLTLEHYSGINITFHHYPDGSGSAMLSAREGIGGEPCELVIAPPVITEYLTCTTCDPTRWHERPAWIRNPRPYDMGVHRLYRQQSPRVAIEQEAAAKARWFATIQEELLQRIVATL
jgi:hypothetical protein